jgi:mRNA-degrading endonuclease RelE of RelBE toxin-antitoxin system
MKYEVKFPSHSIEKKFEKVLLNISPAGMREEIMFSVENLSLNPRPYGEKSFKKLKPPIQFYEFTAQYRLRRGDYRVLYDVDDEKRIV